MTFKTIAGEKVLSLGLEKESGKSIYAMISGVNDIFILDEAAFNYIDKPLKEIIEVFAFIINISDVNKILVEMDGKVIDIVIQTDPDDSDNDKFTVNDKDASMTDEDDKQPFRKYYQALIGVTLSEVAPDDIPPSKPAEIIFTYTLKKAPYNMKVEYVSKDDRYYYVLRNGEYTGILVEKKKFDNAEGVRETYKTLMQAIEAAK